MIIGVWYLLSIQAIEILQEPFLEKKDTTRASSFDYWSRKAKPEVEPSTPKFSSPNSPNPYFNLKFCFFFKRKNLFDLFLVNVFFIL